MEGREIEKKEKQKKEHQGGKNMRARERKKES